MRKKYRHASAKARDSVRERNCGFRRIDFLPRKLAMVCAKGTLDFREEVICFKVILNSG